MKIHKYEDYSAYRAAQIAANHKKINEFWIKEEEVKEISDYILKNMKNISSGLCHGVRRGKEQEWFSKYLNIKVLGTDISDTATNFPNTIQWDFHEIKDEWVNSFDFIYSNSLDHSYDPSTCLDQWMKCVKKLSGKCFIEWSDNSTIDFMNSTDCFGASFEEYKYMFENKYLIENIIELKSGKRRKKSIFVIRHRCD